MLKTRNPITAVVKGNWLVIVCDDGSVWYADRLADKNGWEEYPPIPGSEADAEDKN